MLILFGNHRRIYHRNFVDADKKISSRTKGVYMIQIHLYKCKESGASPQNLECEIGGT